MSSANSEQEGEEKRPQFGTRYLEDESKVFEHNAWDDIEWDEEMENEAKEKISKNSSQLVNKEMQDKYEEEAGKFWDTFYNQHQNKFFKDRHWLFTEFEELAKTGTEENKKRIFEVGCGVGNTVFPILQRSNEKNIFVYCCDFADSAINIVKQHELYDNERCHGFVCDVADENAEFPIAEESLDTIVLIFVLSAIHPDRMLSTMQRLVKLLKPGGMLLFRDYGLYDLAQLRFKPGRCLSENFYVRGDGTRVYFFTQDELNEMFTKCGLVKEQNIADRRLQVNRGRQLKMYRVWIQCKYRKPLT